MGEPLALIGGPVRVVRLRRLRQRRPRLRSDDHGGPAAIHQIFPEDFPFAGFSPAVPRFWPPGRVRFRFWRHAGHGRLFRPRFPGIVRDSAGNGSKAHGEEAGGTKNRDDDLTVDRRWGPRMSSPLWRRHIIPWSPILFLVTSREPPTADRRRCRCTSRREDRLPGRLLERRRGQALEVAGHVHLRLVVAKFALHRRAEPDSEFA